LFPKRSIRTRFIFQILVASATLLIIFSSLLYVYIQQSIYDQEKQELIVIAQKIKEQQSIQKLDFNKQYAINLTVEQVTLKHSVPLFLQEERQEQKYILRMYYPYDLSKLSYLKMTKDFTLTKELLEKILNSIFVINAISSLIIIVYAFAFSKMLISPITAFTERLATMNENFINPINLKRIPVEFVPLGESVNMLIKRIQTFVKYQKELFIGTAHELKTPLAVMKLKNDVTLIKKRDPEAYIEALQINNSTINGMNRIVADILNVGRQESAHFEKPVKVDVIDLLRKKGEDFQLLANNEGKELLIDLDPHGYILLTQPTLINQIIQNFLQNALKFTPKGKSVKLRSKLSSRGLKIQVIDEGCGIDESTDFFAPFKRSGDKSGAGLGLFLAKSAAEALHANISIRNRKNTEGTVATLILTSNLTCKIPRAKTKKI